MWIRAVRWFAERGGLPAPEQDVYRPKLEASEQLLGTSHALWGSEPGRDVIGKIKGDGSAHLGFSIPSSAAESEHIRRCERVK